MFFRVLLFFLSASFSNALLLNDEECLNYTVYPVQYDLTIIPYIYKNQQFYYDCDLTITVIANAPDVKMIELDARDLEIKTGSIKVLDGDINLVNNYRPYEYNKVKGKLYIYLKDSLKQYSLFKTQYYIKIAFSKYVKYDSAGIFAVKYEDSGPKYMYVTRISPNKAKYFFPCFDNPRFEAVFKFRVYVSSAHTGVQYTNTSVVIAKELRRTNLKDYVLIDYMPSPQVALYQVGFHHSQFVNRQVTARYTNDTLIVWAPAPSLQYYSFILGFGKSIINFIHEYTGLNRALVNGPINLIAVPSNLNGYEVGSWNLLTNSDTKMKYVSQYTSIKQIDRMIFELSQQLCRIWLGNPGESEITKWKEEWFKEGVATYFAHYFLAQYYYGVQSLKYKHPIDAYGIDMRHKAMAIDWHHTTPALITFNRTLAIEIPSRYKELVTMKTASILWMVENWLGSEKFHQALVKYINSRRGKYISLSDFNANLDTDTVECLNQFFNGSTASRVLNSWFHRHGYPVVNVDVLRDRTPNVIQLKQRQFSFTSTNRDESDYLIPISYVVQYNQNCFNCYLPRFTIGIQTYTFEENLNGGWIILNRNASGYYRVNYDIETWRLIAKTLKQDRMSIEPLNRAQIVNDVLALYVAGDLNYHLAIEVLDYLELENSPVVWEAVIQGFELLKIEGANCQMSRALYEQWQEFMRNKVAMIYRRPATDIDQQQQLSVRRFRSSIVQFATTVKYQTCLRDLARKYNEHVQTKARLDPDIREACYYQIYNEGQGAIEQGELDRFEQEDLLAAERNMKENQRFLFRIPMGVPKPMPIMMSTTVAPTEPSSTSKVVTTTPSASVSNAASVLSLVVSSFFMVILR